MGMEHDSPQDIVFFIRNLKSPDQVVKALADPENPYRLDPNIEIVGVKLREGSKTTLKDDLGRYGRLTLRGMNKELQSAEKLNQLVADIEYSAEEVARAYLSSS